MSKLLTYKLFLSVAKLGQTQKTNVSSAHEEAILFFQIIVQYICLNRATGCFHLQRH